LPEERVASSYRVANVPNAPSDHVTWEVTADRRLRGRWSLVAGFSHTWTRDQASGYSGQAVRANQYPLTPNDLVNTGEDGRHEFRAWSARASGTWEGPWGLRITPFLRHQSGQPYGRTFQVRTGSLNLGPLRVLAEPIGTRRMDNITLAYTFPYRGQRMRVFGTLQNAFTITGYSGVDPTAGLLGIDNNIYPRAQTFTGGLTVQF